MTRILIGIFGFLLLGMGYLAFWPVPIDPVAWEAPTSNGYTGDFAANNVLTQMDLISIGSLHGPEDATTDGQNLFTSTREGKIIRINPEEGSIKTIADTGGNPLGLDYVSRGVLIVADAYKGLLEVSLDGTVSLLTDNIDGDPIRYADDVVTAPDGRYYFTDASTRFSAKRKDVEGSLLEIIEHGRSGRVLSYDPNSGATALVEEGLSFPNGISISADGASLMVVETGEYKVTRIWIAGEKAGTSEPVIENLPGFPDNITIGPDGTFFVGIVTPRSAFIDDNSGNPGARRFAMRLPAFLRPEADLYGLVFQMDSDGDVLRTWQGNHDSFGHTSGGISLDGKTIFITSPDAASIGRLPIH